MPEAKQKIDHGHSAAGYGGVERRVTVGIEQAGLCHRWLLLLLQTRVQTNDA